MDPKELRRAFGTFATGITVVAINHGGELHGMTANSFTSVGLEPPLVLVCVVKDTKTHTMMAAEKRFAVSVLNNQQQQWSDQFAGRFPEKRHLFDAPHRLGGVTQQPILEGALGWFECSLWATYDGGDHDIFVGKVEAFGRTAEEQPQPLCYFAGRYRGLAPEGSA